MAQTPGQFIASDPARWHMLRLDKYAISLELSLYPCILKTFRGNKYTWWVKSCQKVPASFFSIEICSKNRKSLLPWEQILSFIIGHPSGWREKHTGTHKVVSPSGKRFTMSINFFLNVSNSQIIIEWKVFFSSFNDQYTGKFWILTV